MRQLTSDPPADFTAVNQAAFTDLSVRTASFTAGTIKTTGQTAAEPITERLTLAGLGTVTIRSQLHLVQVQGHWLVQLVARHDRADRSSRATSCRCRKPGRPGEHPGLGRHAADHPGPGGDDRRRGPPGQERRGAAVRAGRRGRPRVGGQSALTAAKTHPTFFEPVFTVTRSRYNQLQPTIYPIPCTVFQSSTARTAITPGLAAGLVGTVGPITAQELAELGVPYDAESIVGQTGLEQADERQLGGPAGRHGCGRHRRRHPRGHAGYPAGAARGLRSGPRSSLRYSRPPNQRLPGRTRTPRWSR